MAYKYRSGLRPGSSKNLMIGPGAMYKNFDLTKFDVNDPTTWGELLGATQGGNKVTVELEYYSVEFDGALGAIDGAEWLIGAVAKVESTLLEVTPENIKLQLPNFNSSSFNDDYDLISHNGEIAPSATHNLAIIGEVVGKHVPVIFVLHRARATTPFDLGLGTGKESVTLPITLEARYSEEEPTLIPFYILYPKGGSPVAAPTPDVPGGIYTAPQTVRLAGPPGAKLYYTTDGSIPTPATAPEYTGTPITVTATTTIKVIAVIGADVSTIATYEYIINTAPGIVTVTPPTASVAAGTYATAQSVELTADATAVIHYTTDGTAPTTASDVYTAPIDITATTTLKAIAVIGTDVSVVATFEYTITP